MRQANALRGEVALELGEITFLLRPAFQSLVAAEAEVGSLVILLERAGAGDLRLVEQWQALGYRQLVNHYVGMSHYYALTSVGGGRYEVASGLSPAAEAWHASLFEACKKAGFSLIVSLSFELFGANCPEAWMQRDWEGSPALTGWSPPSALLSPCHEGAMDWLQSVAAHFAALANIYLDDVNFQVGEPWWWVNSSGAPCFYDSETVAAWWAEKGVAAPEMSDVLGERTALEREYLDWLGAKLATATAAVREAARAAVGASPFKSHLLFFAPQVLLEDKPDLMRANMPVGWAYPEWDILQLEDYDFVTSGDEWGLQRGRDAVTHALGYPLSTQHYLAGFVLERARAHAEWPLISDAARGALGREIAETFVWAWPQIQRDGFVWQQTRVQEDDEMQSFHDVIFPLALGFDAVGGPVFSTQVAELSSGYEQRNVQWSQAKLHYDAGLGIRSEQDLATLLQFFRARRGQGFAFRFKDPLDHSSAAYGAAVTALDQLLAVGDGSTLTYNLCKRYGEGESAEIRRITRPVRSTVCVSVDGVTMVAGWHLLDGGVIQFEIPPASGSEIRAGFEYDVPVRFGSDRMDITLAGFRAGEVPSVPLVEVRE